MIINDHFFLAQFSKSLSETDRAPVEGAVNNCDQILAYDMFISKYKRHYNDAFPLETSLEKEIFRRPRMISELKSFETKDKLYFKYIKSTTDSNNAKYKVNRSKFKQLKIGAERM